MITHKVTKQIPYACPVCKGKGEIGADLAQHGAAPKYEDTEVYACHACCGSCLIWEIREEDVEEESKILPHLQLPPNILTPQLPYTQPWVTGIEQFKIGPITIGDPPNGADGVTWASANNRPPEMGKSFQAFNSPAWKFGGLNDGGCSCSPPGTPHHDNCKAG